MKHFIDETELVFLLKANNEHAFEYLYDKYSGALFNVVIKIVKDKDTAGDVLQDTFLKIWKAIQTYDPVKGTLFTWMLNIARNKAIDSYRASIKSPIVVTIDAMNEDVSLYAYSTLPMFELENVYQLVKQLQPEKSRLIDLVYIQGYTHEEVSQMLSIPLGTIKSRIRKTLTQLKGYFQIPVVASQCYQ